MECYKKISNSWRGGACCSSVRCYEFYIDLNVFYLLTDSKDILSNSLILMGEIGGNDYNYAFAQKQSIQEIRTYVPSVIDAIRQAVDVSLSILIC